MKRLCVLCFYDSDGIVYDYLLYYIKELLSVCSSMVCIVNGSIRDSDSRKLIDMGISVYRRENTGFDAAAYKYFFEELQSGCRLDSYDELILTNDTVFGPFVPFTEIFEEMNSRNADFWGINFFDNNLYQFIMSNFLVFKKNTFSLLETHFSKAVDYTAPNLHTVCMQFERGLFKWLVENKCSYSFYVRKNALDPYASTNFLFRDFDCPLAKKTGLRNGFEHIKANFTDFLDALRFSEKSNYDISLILDYAMRKFNIHLENAVFDKSCIVSVDYDCNFISGSAVIAFSKKFKCCYIYGTNYTGQDIALYYKNDMPNISGFIVSDDYYETDRLLGLPVRRASDIDLDKFGIIVAVTKRESVNALKSLYGSKSNFLFIRK